MTDMTDMTSIDCDTTSLNAIALRGNPLKWSTFYNRRELGMCIGFSYVSSVGCLTTSTTMAGDQCKHEPL